VTYALWMLSSPAVSAACRAGTVAALTAAGVRVQDGMRLPDGYGLVLLDAADVDFLAQLRPRCGGAPVLAAAVGQPPSTSTLWAWLDQGAADVLCWQDGQPRVQEVVARLARWGAVRDLAASEPVRALLVGASPAWLALVHRVLEVAAFTDSAVLITGETGTGKDLLAQAVHRVGAGRGPFIVLDCTTLAPELAGSELFGHERGAFTGAAAAREGAFALADGGVLFLDEIGELPLALQAQLLRAIQEHQYKRVGGNSWQHARFRLVCATHRDLEAEVEQGRFRADLFYRIAAWRCRTPPLRERSADILPLAAHFLSQLAGGPPPELDPGVREYLLARPYPGNVRELRQTVARLWHRHSGPGPITLGAVPPEERPAAGAAPWPDWRLEQAVRHALALGMGLARITQAAGDLAIQLVLAEEADNNQRAALRLGVTDRALQLRRKAWNSSC